MAIIGPQNGQQGLEMSAPWFLGGPINFNKICFFLCKHFFFEKRRQQRRSGKNAGNRGGQKITMMERVACNAADCAKRK